jgi:transposase
VDRGKPGSKIHALSDRGGLPVAVGVSAANTNEHHALNPLVRAIPAVRCRRGPRHARPSKLPTDKAHDVTELRGWLRQRAITPRIARPGIESSHKLGTHRWVIERSIAWLFGYRRLTTRYERHAHLFCAFLTLAAVLTCYKKLAKAK